MSQPLAAFPIASTSDTDEAQSVLSRELSDLRFTSVRDRNRFQFEMNGTRLGRTTVAFNRFSTQCEVDAGFIESARILAKPATRILTTLPTRYRRLGLVAQAEIS